MRDIPKSARVDKDKNKETLEIYKEYTKRYEDYDFEKLESYLNPFDDIPSDKKEREIQYLVFSIRMYTKTKESNMHLENTKCKRKKYYEALKTAIEFLDSDEIVQDEYEEIEDIKDFISSQIMLLEIRLAKYSFFKPNKNDIKQFLKDVNKKYNLNQSLGFKQLLDNI